MLTKTLKDHLSRFLKATDALDPAVCMVARDHFAFGCMLHADGETWTGVKICRAAMHLAELPITYIRGIMIGLRGREVACAREICPHAEMNGLLDKGWPNGSDRKAGTVVTYTRWRKGGACGSCGEPMSQMIGRDDWVCPDCDSPTWPLPPRRSMTDGHRQEPVKPVGSFVVRSNDLRVGELLSRVPNHEVKVTFAGEDGGPRSFSVGWYDNPFFYKIGQHLEIIDDAFSAFAILPELFDWLADNEDAGMRPAELATKLVQLGFTDKTPRSAPWA